MYLYIAEVIFIFLRNVKIYVINPRGAFKFRVAVCCSRAAKYRFAMFWKR